MSKNIIYRRSLWHFNSTFGSSLGASSALPKLENLKIDKVLDGTSLARRTCENYDASACQNRVRYGFSISA